MSKVKNPMKLIKKSYSCINVRYDMTVENIQDIRAVSKSDLDKICNSFRFGYMQGMKAARAEMKARAVS